MSTIRVCGLVMTDAEDALANIWCVLEKYEMRTPRVQVDMVSDGMIDLRISFKYARDADMMLRGLELSPARLIPAEAPDFLRLAYPSRPRTRAARRCNL